MYAKLLALSAVAGMASAFVPATPLKGVTTSSSAMKMTFENEIGVTRPLGLWDPLGLLEGADQERFDRLRYVEVKHGRISMLAVVGHLVQQNYRLPGYISKSADLQFSDIPNGLGAFTKIPGLGLLQLVAFVGLLETYVWKQQDSGIPGDFGIDWFSTTGGELSDETKTRLRNSEINNGRAAQMGILAMMVHERLSGEPYIINNLCGFDYTFP